MKIFLKTVVATSFGILLSLFLAKNIAPAVSEALVPLPVSPINRSVALSTDEVIDSLQSTYGIRIGRAGQKAGLKTTDAQYRIKCRQPSQFELMCLRQAIEKSGSAIRTKGRSTGIAIYFLTDPLCCGAAADWGIDQNDHPAIFIEAAARSDELQYIFLHELAHNSAHRLGFDPSSPASWKLSSKLGWTNYYNPDTNESGWSIKLTGPETYKRSSVSADWVRVNGRGQPLNSDGVRVKHQVDAEHCSAMQIMERAQVTPITTYFPNPMEVYAEAMACYRDSEEKRTLLKCHSPQLFEIIEKEDQRDRNM